MLQIDYKSGISICDQVVNGFIKLIAIGVLSTDNPLPSVRSMALKLSVNPNTIQKAYTILEERGVIYSVKGKGSFVADGSMTKAAIFSNEQKKLTETITDACNVGYPLTEVIKIAKEIYNKEVTEKND